MTIICHSNNPEYLFFKLILGGKLPGNKFPLFINNIVFELTEYRILISSVLLVNQKIFPF